MNTIDTMSVNAIRVLSADAIQKAKSGHPGLPLGSAPAAYELWMNHMNHNPADPQWANRDRFILSGGHGSMLLYSLLHLLSLRLLCSLLHLWLWSLLICLVQCIHTRLNCILHAVPYLLHLLLLRSRFVWLRIFAACAL